MPASNVIAFPVAELGVLGLAATSGTGNRVSGSRNEIWLCPAFGYNNQQLMLYVKLGLSTRALMAEALCSLLGQCIGLDVPPPFLVTTNPRHVGRPSGAVTLAFGSLDLAQQSMARPVRDLEVLFSILQTRRIEDLACVFDEWIANPVRSPSDILVSPDSRLYLIDHECAFPEHLPADQGATNWLADRLIAGLDGKDRHQFLRKLRSRLARLQRIQLGQAPGIVQFSQEGVPIYTALLQFLTDRLQHLDRLCSERVLPEQPYLTAPQPPAVDLIADATDRPANF